MGYLEYALHFTAFMFLLIVIIKLYMNIADRVGNVIRQFLGALWKALKGLGT